ncbi:MAG: phosphoglycerate kinase [Candidatus Aminicenantes bacterium]|nr:phosphoglycerate kinase [Candidatus Aminicenantes bacterium]
MLFFKDLDLHNKRVFLRVDFNVPLDENGNITDDTRIKAVLPTLNHLSNHKAQVIIGSHLGRPKGKKDSKLSLKPVAQMLSSMLPQKITLAPDCIGKQVSQLKSHQKKQDIILLENLRFHPEEKQNDDEFARELAEDIDYYVNDAFAACHRSHASIVAITQFVKKAAAGFVVRQEMDYFQRIIEAPQRPYIAILGGAKVSDKIPVLKNLIKKADAILIGGAMSYTFFKAMKFEVGRSLVEEDKKDLSLELLKKAEDKGVKVFLPSDHVIAKEMKPGAEYKNITRFPIPNEYMGLDIGPETIKKYSKFINNAKTVFWNGPMGVFEIKEFSQGTAQIAKAVASSDTLSIVGGGDSVSALKKTGLEKKISHISTGGGASLELIANETLPGIKVLSEDI